MSLNIVERFKRNGVNMSTAVCACGKTFTTRSSYLRSGHTKSCGCARKNGASLFKPTHGLTETREYRIWSNAKDRCYRKSNPHYNNYGGRGITMSPEWKNNFCEFYLDMGPCLDDMTLERINNNGPYSKENCRWASWKDQCNNRRSNVLVEIDGKTMNIRSVADMANLSYSTVWARFRRGVRGSKLLEPKNKE